MLKNQDIVRNKTRLLWKVVIEREDDNCGSEIEECTGVLLDYRALTSSIVLIKPYGKIFRFFVDEVISARVGVLEPFEVDDFLAGKMNADDVAEYLSSSLF
jgi:hypothetical protein